MITPPFVPGRRRRREEKLNQPVIKPEMGPVDLLLEVISIILLLGFFGYTFYYFRKLPDTIPTHFNAAGTPDDYSGKESFWVLPGIGLFIYLLMTLIALIPHRFNFAVKITPENAMKQYTLALRFIRLLKLLILALFFYISISTVRSALHLADGMGLWFIPVTLAGFFIPFILYLIISSRNR